MYGHVGSHKTLTDVLLLVYNSFEIYDRYLLLNRFSAHITGRYYLYTGEPRIYRQKAES